MDALGFYLDLRSWFSILISDHDSLSFQVGSVAGVFGLSSELNGVSLRLRSGQASDTSEFRLTKANNSLAIFSHEDQTPCVLSHPEKPACRTGFAIGLYAGYPLDLSAQYDSLSTDIQGIFRRARKCGRTAWNHSLTCVVY